MNSLSTSESHFVRLDDCLAEVEARLAYKKDPNNYRHAERFPEKNLLVHNCVNLYDKYNKEASLHLQTGMENLLFGFVVDLIDYTVCHSRDAEDRKRCIAFQKSHSARKQLVSSFETSHVNRQHNP